MPAQVDSQRRTELQKWLSKINPDMAKSFETSYAMVDNAEKTQHGDHQAYEKARDQVVQGAKAEAAREAKEKSQDVHDAKVLGVSPEGMDILADWLKQLDAADLNGTFSAQVDQSTGSALLDKLLARSVALMTQARSWPAINDAVSGWAELRKQLRPILDSARDHFTPHKNRPAVPESTAALTHISASEHALSSIEAKLAKRQVLLQYGHDVSTAEVPQMGEEIAWRAAEREITPAMEALKAVAGLHGKVAKAYAQDFKSEKLKNLDTVVSIYFKVTDFKDKLEEFHKAGLFTQVKTVSEFSAFVVDIGKEAAEKYTEAAKHLAQLAGKHEVVEGLEKRLGVLKTVGKVVAVYEAVKSVVELAEAIESGDWHKIAKAGVELVSAGAGTLETFGVISADASATVSSAAMVIWAEAEALSMIADLHRYGVAHERVEASNRLIEVARKCAPHGRAIAVAAKMMVERNGQPGVEVLEQKFQSELMPNMQQCLKALAFEYTRKEFCHFGFYDELPSMLGRPASDAILGNGNWDAMFKAPGPPFAVAEDLAERFRVICNGMRTLSQQVDRQYGKDANYNPDEEKR